MMKPKVSVVMITYGHEKYIEQAISGVLMQKTDFQVEFIIANDNSPDNSDTIIRKCIENTPENITVKYTRQEKNLGMMPNFIWALRQAKGEYIALCEGDDYWTDENKLQKQVSFLDYNSDVAIACHNFYMLDGSTMHSESIYDKQNVPSLYGIEKMSENNLVPTLTAMFRNIDIVIPQWWYTSPLGDLPLFLTLAKNGEIFYDSTKMAVYRQNVGIWSGKKTDHLKMIDFYSNLSNDFKEFPVVKKNLNSWKSKHIKEYLKEIGLQKAIKNSLFKNLSGIDKLKLICRLLSNAQ